MGIAPADLAHVFEPFYRSSPNQNQSGTGLGLATVKAIVDLHGSHITLRNNQPGLVVNIQFHPYYPMGVHSSTRQPLLSVT